MFLSFRSPTVNSSPGGRSVRAGPEAKAVFARTVFTRAVLDRLGGPLFEGHRAAGPRTAEMVEALRAPGSRRVTKSSSSP